MTTNNKKGCPCCETETVAGQSSATHIMLVGNPNCGKSTLFNRLCNVHVRTGNYPGVTVTKSAGKYSDNIQIIDLPGIYSLTSVTAEERIASVELLRGKADLIVNIADATSLERSLYLTLELRMLGIPMVLFLNMWDAAERKNIKVDIDRLSSVLGIPVIPLSATTGMGVDDCRKFLDQGHWDECPAKCIGSEELNASLNKLAEELPPHLRKNGMFIARSALERDYVPEEIFRDESYQKKVSEVREELSRGKSDIYEFFAGEHYATISGILKECYFTDNKIKTRTAFSSKLDKLVLNRYLAFPVFLVIMCLVYFIGVSWLGSIITDWTNDELFGEMIIPASSEFLDKVGASEWLTSLISEGIIGGVGAVLGFVPQLIILFLLISILEECGYMTRAAFILDRVFHWLGLSGRAFIPYLISTGCGVPALMTARTLGGESERRMVLFTANMIPCGAKLPVIVVFGGAIFSDHPVFAPAMYLLGIAVIILSGLIMKKFRTFKPSLAPLMLELPSYHIPSIRVVLNTVYQRSKAFIIKAGTIIFASVTFVWLLSHMAYDQQEGFRMVGDEEQEISVLAEVAKPVSKIFTPLGFSDYRSGVSVIMGLVAKENIVSTMAIFSGSEDEEDPSFYDNLRNNIFHGDLLVALSFVLFNLFTIPCLASVGVIKRELGDMKLFIMAMAYQLLMSYGLAMIVYQIGNLFLNGVFGVATGISIGLIILFVYVLFFKKSAAKNADSDISFRMMKNAS
ncbi:MAG: ferrous iron transport protein B [Succinivibrionaceae bacterium]